MAGLLLVVLLTAILAAPASAQERWVATSTTALSVTGTITFSPERIAFQTGTALPIVRQQASVPMTIAGERVVASIYRVVTPQDPVLLRGNRLCGAGNVTFAAVWQAAGPGRSVAFYTGAAAPPQNTNLCGVYNYEIADQPARSPTGKPGR